MKSEKEELKESERMYRAIFEGTNEGILCADSKTKKFILANPQICKMLGYTENELTKLGVPDIHPKKDLPYVLQQFNKQAKGEITVARNLPVLRKDKKVLYCDISAKSMQIDSKKVLLGLFSDVTERRKTEETLSKFKFIVENAGEEFYLVHPDGKMAYANTAAAKSLGYTKEEVSKMKVADFDKQHGPKFHEYSKNLNAKKAYDTVETTHTTKDGRKITKNMTSVYLKIGEEEYVCGFATDITEKKKTEEELKEKEERYRILYKISADAIMTLEPPNWKFTAGNPAAVKMFKCKNEKDFTSRAPYELSPEKQPDGQPSMPKALKMINTAMEKGSQFFEWTHRRATGEDFPATVLLTRTEIKDKKFLQATVRDISAEKKTEEELKKSEKTFEDLYEASIMMTGSHQDVLQKICDKVHDIFDGFFVLVNFAKAGEFHFKAGCNLPTEIISAGKEPIKGAICSHILESKKPLFTNDLEKAKCPTCKMPYTNDPAVKAFKLKTYFGVPLIFSDGSTNGTLCIVFEEKKEPFIEKEIKIMTLLAKRVAIEVEREEEETERKKKTDEIAKFTKFAIGRELRMMELKKKMAMLEKKKANE